MRAPSHFDASRASKREACASALRDAAASASAPAAGPVGGTAVVTLWHYLRERSKAKKAAAAGEDVVTDHDEAEALVLDPEVFDRGPEHHEGDAPKA